MYIGITYYLLAGTESPAEMTGFEGAGGGFGRGRIS